MNTASRDSHIDLGSLVAWLSACHEFKKEALFNNFTSLDFGDGASIFFCLLFTHVAQFGGFVLIVI